MTTQSRAVAGEERTYAETAAPVGRAPAAGVSGRKGLRHINALDGLRGVAVLGVLLYHGGHLKGGYLGVDLFFVLSGYLITSLLLSEWRGTGDIRLGNFWSRRARRLFPALVIVLVAVAAYAQFVAPPTSLGRIRADGLATLFYVANWHDIFSGHVYGDQFAAQSPLLHTWSLAIEEQFYVVWPLVVVGLLRWRNKPQVILKVSLGVVAVSIGLMIGLNAAGVAADPGLYEGTETRIAAIAMGAALAAWQMARGHTRDDGRRIALEAAAAACLVFLGAMWAFTDLSTGLLFWGGLALCGAAVTVVIAAISHPDDLLVGPILSFAPFRWLGLISYGLYLWHWPIFLYLSESRTGLSGWPLFLLQLFVSFDVAVLSYFVVEKPIRYGAIKGPNARAAVPAAAAITVIALLASTMGAVAPGGGFAGKQTDTKLVGGATGTPKVMMVGDSVAYGLTVEGVVPLHDQLKVAVSNNAYVGCNLLLGMGKVFSTTGKQQGPPAATDCTTKWPDQVAKVHPDVVIMVFGAYPAFNVEIDGTRHSPCDATYRKAFKARLVDVAKTLTASGATLVISTIPSTDNPFVRNDLPDVDQRTTCANEDILAVAAANPKTIKAVDLDAYVCPNGQCKKTVDGVKLREDGLHFKGKAAEYVVRWMVPEALKASGKGG